MKTYVVKITLEREVEAKSENDAVWSVICDVGDMSEDKFEVDGKEHILEPEEED
jgi:hypothetical protein